MARLTTPGGGGRATAPRFHLEPPLNASPGDTLALPDAVAHHATRVLRLDTGDAVTLFDGSGGEYRATIVAAAKRDVTVRIDAFDGVDRESPLDVALVQSLLAADAMDYAIRKSVELGVRGIVPVVAARSQNTLAGGRADKRLAHWRSVAIAACEQCGRNRVPPIAEPQPLESWMRDAEQGRRPAVIAGPGASTSLASFAAVTPPAAVVVGPEGGFIAAEIALAAERGIVAVHLGPRVLRAETAAVAALATLQAVAGDAR